MAEPTANFTIEGMEVVAESADMRFTKFHLGPGESIPWHIHTEVADWYICLEGQMRVETSPGPGFDLEPGGMGDVQAKTAHHVVNTGDGDCRFVIVQGVGAYDFVTLDD